MRAEFGAKEETSICPGGMSLSLLLRSTGWLTLHEVSLQK